jgi:hypothetical protein
MRVEFYGGPQDGLQEDCDVSFPGQEWRVLCGPVSCFVVSKEDALTLPDVNMPVARYRLSGGRMSFIGYLA